MIVQFVFEHYSLETEFGAADELYKAIITLDKKRVSELKANGVSLTENVRNVLENGAGRKYNDNPAFDFWHAFLREIKGMPLEEFSETAAMLRAETSKPLYYSDASWLWGNNRCFEPSFFQVTLQNFDQKRMPRRRTLQRIIDEDALGCLPICEKHGWLKNPKSRDELISYANENGKTEAVAWLLDFKNRTADLVAERERAERKILRELNANPNSLTELKKVWGFEKYGDGSVIITGYKGNRTEIVVPERIGGDIVVALGEYAFSPLASRLRYEQRKFRYKNITKITLPDSIREIGPGAFSSCTVLSEVNIPDGVTKIKDGTFGWCNLNSIVIPASVTAIGKGAFASCLALTEITLPDGVQEIDEYAFGNCDKLKTIVLPSSVKRISSGLCPFWECYKMVAFVHEGSYAEEFCKQNNINMQYYGGA